MAEQTEPVRRRVALKVIKLGMDTKQVIARFEAERQALALMDHPNIAKVLDAGATETGRPYFVMELVRGIKITEFCDEKSVPTADRLKLFTQVCQAIQHAHQKGVIHRDIKPSNILVTVNDGVPVPKIIDFGIAKATAGPLTDKTFFTAFEQFIGTPAYMSPEQAEMTSLDIDTRTDIYSLGVLLYELLTGRTPFDPSELLQSGLDEMRRTIREKEPDRPSTRLSTMAEGELTTVAKHRHTEAPRLIHLVRGDLDWIVMKCLEKDRTRRYETANGLASDIQGHLNNEPVVARPPSTAYRFQKLVLRNKVMVGAVGAVLTAIVLGLGLSTWLFFKEREARKRAVAAEREQIRLREATQRTLANEIRLRQSLAKDQKAWPDSPAKWEGHLNDLVGLLLVERRFDEVEQVFTEVVTSPVASNLDGISLLKSRGNFLARRGRFKEAADDLTKVIEFEPDDSSQYHKLAPLLAASGEVERYRQLCHRIVAKFGASLDPAIADPMAKSCLILPNAGVDPEVVGRLAEIAVRQGAKNEFFVFFQFCKGLAEYRQGHFASAADWMRKAISKNGYPWDDLVHFEAYMVLAMADYKLQQNEQAQAALTTGIEIAETKLPRLDSEDLGAGWSPGWIDLLIGHALMREARALVDGGSNFGTGQK
jgi:tetratricopeptide (TPR) repeat protein